MPASKLSTDDTARLLNKEAEYPIEIMPNGEVRAQNDSPPDVKPTTMTEDLGGEYATIEKRVGEEIKAAKEQWPNFKPVMTRSGRIALKDLLLQSNEKTVYQCLVNLPSNYPHIPPSCFILHPPTPVRGPHKWGDGSLCLFMPKKWNPGRHDLSFIIARMAKWINKFEVWKKTKEWPGLNAHDEG